MPTQAPHGFPIVAWAGMAWDGSLVVPEAPEGPTVPPEGGLGRPLDFPVPPPLQREFRRIGRFNRYALGASLACLARAGDRLAPPSRIGVFIGTGFGSLADSDAINRDLWNRGAEFLSPTAFVNTVSHACQLLLARYLGGPSEAQVLSQENLSFEAALAAAVLRLELGEIDQAIVCGADAWWGPDTDHRLRLGGPAGLPDLPLGEGAGALLLAAPGAPGRFQLCTPRLGRATQAPTSAELAAAAITPWVGRFGHFPTASALAACAWLSGDRRGNTAFRHSAVSPSGETAAFAITDTQD